MKTIQITETKKELLLVEVSNTIDYEVLRKGTYTILENYQTLCAYTDITEGIAEELVGKVMGEQHYVNYNSTKVYDRWANTALESFNSAIEKQSRTFDKNKTLIFVKI